MHLTAFSKISKFGAGEATVNRKVLLIKSILTLIFKTLGIYLNTTKDLKKDIVTIPLALVLIPTAKLPSRFGLAQ